MQQEILEFDRRGEVVNTEVTNLSTAERRKNLSEHIIQTAHHFNKRVQHVFNFIKTPKSIGDYNSTDYFHRSEFQQRGLLYFVIFRYHLFTEVLFLTIGSPHIHSLIWLEDIEGEPAPHYREGEDGSAERCVNFIDNIISGKRDHDDPKLQELVSTMQNHSHTFTCRKKFRTYRIGPKEGHGRLDGQKVGPELKLQTCRFNFPRPPMRETKILHPPDVTGKTLREWEGYRRKIRNFMNRQTFVEYAGQESDARMWFLQLSYDEFLTELGLNEDQYLNGLRASLKTKGAQAFLKRDPADVFTINFSPKITLLQRANTDATFIINEYGMYHTLSKKADVWHK